MKRSSEICRSRFEELDLLRGLAIVGMVIYHLLFILNFFGVYGVNLEFSAMQIFAGIVRFDFLVLVGVGMVISYYRILGKMENSVSLGRARWCAILQQWKRGAMVGGVAMVVTVATYFYVREDFVRFGILHLIAVSILFWSFFVERKWVVLILALVSFWMGGWFEWMRIGGVDFSGVWLGYFLRDRNWNAQSVDYFPLFPWIGMVGIGVFLGHIFYPKGVRRGGAVDAVTDDGEFVSGAAGYARSAHYAHSCVAKLKKPICFLGRHSLAVYMIHVPVIMVVLWALRLVKL